MRRRFANAARSRNPRYGTSLTGNLARPVPMHEFPKKKLTTRRGGGKSSNIVKKGLTPHFDGLARRIGRRDAQTAANRSVWIMGDGPD